MNVRTAHQHLCDLVHQHGDARIIDDRGFELAAVYPPEPPDSDEEGDVGDWTAVQFEFAPAPRCDTCGRINGHTDLCPGPPMKDHLPIRPGWLCGRCGRTWPCRPAEQALDEQYTGDPQGLARALTALLADYIHDHDHDTWNRFIGWAPARHKSEARRKVEHLDFTNRRKDLP